MNEEIVSARYVMSKFVSQAAICRAMVLRLAALEAGAQRYIQSPHTKSCVCHDCSSFRQLVVFA